MTSRLNFSGRKILGASLAPNPNDPGGLISAYDMRQMWQVWDWDGWIKPQIDFMLGNCGFNTIRILGAVWDVASELIPASEYLSKSMQLAKYLAERGAYYYPNGSSINSYIDYDLSAGDLADVFCTFLNPVQDLGNSIGVDLFQEGSIGFFTTQFLVDLRQALRDRGMMLPVTCSTSLEVTGGGVTWVNDNISAFDFLDFHIYTFPPGMDYLDYYLVGTDMDILIGETGKNQSPSAVTGGGSADTVVSDLSTVYALGLSGHPRLRGVLHWSAADQRSDVQFPVPSELAERVYGIFDTNTTPNVFAPRKHKVDLMRRYTRGSCALSKAI